MDKSLRERPKPGALVDFERGADSPNQISLNDEQLASLAFYFAPDNPYREDDGVAITHFAVDRQQLVINGCYLHSDGSWATFHEDDGNMVIYI